MPQVYEEGNVDAHILFGDDEPKVHCYDKRQGLMEVKVEISLLTRLPDGYGDDEISDLPTPEFVIEAMQSVLRHLPLLWKTWEDIRREF